MHNISGGQCPYLQVVLLGVVEVSVILKYVDEPVLDVRDKLGGFRHLAPLASSLQQLEHGHSSVQVPCFSTGNKQGRLCSKAH